MKNLKKRIISIFLVLVMVLTMLPADMGVDTAKAADTTGSLSLTYRYGTGSLIQMNTNLPSDTPCVSFTASDNGCSIDQSGNTVQWVGWIGMDNVDGTIVLTFHFNNAFTAGQSYVLPKGAIFGFTDGKTYSLDGDYTFTFDGSVWTMTVENQVVIPDELSFTYRYGTSQLIQVNTNLPASTPLANFTTGDNGCSIDESGNTVQWVGWIQMDNVDGVIVLTFHFNNAFTAGQSYVLPAGAIFGFTDGNTYPLDKNYTFTFDGSSWAMTAETEPEEPEEEIPTELTFEYRYGANNLIQVNTNLPSSTPCVNFTASDNGCNIDQSANQYQQVGWIQMTNDNGVIVLTFHFNSTFESGQTYVLPQGAIFGFTDGNTYPLDKNYTFTFDGSSWSMVAEAEPEEEIPEELTFEYRYGANNLIQVNTNLPSSTPCASFLATDNGCNIDQSANQYQQFGYVEMANVDGVIVLTFRFNAAFESGQTYVLPKGAIFGFTDGNTYPLDKYYTFTFDGSSWSMVAETEQTPEEEEIGKLTLDYRYGTESLIQVNTDLPTTTTCANFLATDNECDILQSGSQSFGWAAMELVDGTIVITFHFNSAFTTGQTYKLSRGSIFGFSDGTKYELEKTYTFAYDGSTWSVEVEETYGKLSLEYRYGANNLIQVNTNLPTTTTCANFLATDNGCELVQGGSQSFGWASMTNADGTIVITFNFNSAFTAGQTYALSQGSIFGFSDGTKYKLDHTYIFTYDGSSWTLAVVGDTNDDTNVDSVDLIRMKKAETEIYIITEQYDIVLDEIIDHWDLNRERDIILERDSWDDGIMETTDYLLDPLRFDGGEEFVSFADLPVDATDTAKIEEFKALGFNTSLLTEDDADPDIYSATCVTSDEITVDGNILTLEYTKYTNGKCIQFKTNLSATGQGQEGIYKNFLADPTSGYNIKQSGAQNAGWFGMDDENGTEVYFVPQFNAYFDNNDQYILEAGSTFTFGGVVYTLDRTYTVTVKNDYLASIQNLDKEGMNIWIRNYTNKADYFTTYMTDLLALHKDKIDGFYIVDEPFMTQELYDYSIENYSESEVTESFDNISSTLIPWFNSNYADTYFHINHVPMSSYNHYGSKGDTAASDSNYLNFFNTYATDILDSVSTSNEKKTIGFDYYPLGYTTVEKVLWWENTDLVETGIAPNYLLNMLIPAKAAKDNDATFSICIQTFDRSYGDKTREITTAEEVSFQLYSAMACGADMFEFFTYNSLIDSANNTTYNGIIDLDGNKTELYDGVKTANTNAFSFADVVNAFDWQGVQVSSGSTSKNATGITTAKNSSLDLLLDDDSIGALSGVTSDDDALVGYYTKGLQAGYMVANYNDPKLVTTNNTVTLTFTDCTKARVYTSVDGKLTSEVVTLTNNSYTHEVAPGGAFFIIPVNAQ